MHCVPKLYASQKFWNFVGCKMFDLRRFKIAKINFILTQVSVKSLMQKILIIYYYKLHFFVKSSSSKIKYQ